MKPSYPREIKLHSLLDLIVMNGSLKFPW